MLMSLAKEKKKEYKYEREKETDDNRKKATSMAHKMSTH